MHTHTCQVCGDKWDGGDTPFQVGEDTWECQCRSQDTCEGCTPDLYRPLCVECDEAGDYALGVSEVEGPLGRQWACARHADAAGEAGAAMWATPVEGLNEFCSRALADKVRGR